MSYAGCNINYWYSKLCFVLSVIIQLIDPGIISPFSIYFSITLLELLSQLPLACRLSSLWGRDSRNCRDRRVILNLLNTVFCRQSRNGMSTVENSRLSRHCRRQSVDNSSTPYPSKWCSIAGSASMSLYTKLRKDYCNSTNYYRPIVVWGPASSLNNMYISRIMQIPIILIFWSDFG